MARIPEHFVSKEVAILMISRGFDWDCEVRKYYPENEYDEEDPNGIYAPTQMMALEWMKSVHKIFIEISVIDLDLCTWQLYYSDGPIRPYDGVGKDPYEAIDNALKYCLKNLVY